MHTGPTRYVPSAGGWQPTPILGGEDIQGCLAFHTEAQALHFVAYFYRALDRPNPFQPFPADTGKGLDQGQREGIEAEVTKFIAARQRQLNLLLATAEAVPVEPADRLAPAGAEVTPPERLAFDDLTHVVTLDGTPHKVENPKAYAVYKLICRKVDPTITKAGLQAKATGLRGQKTIPNLIAALPPALRATVKVSTNGYWIDLPGLPAGPPPGKVPS